MTTSSPQRTPDAGAGATPPRAVRIPPTLRRAALQRLLGTGGQAPAAAIDNFLAQAQALGIDLELMAGVCSPSGGVTQACLPVMGSGRTVMLFVSGGLGPPSTTATAERAAAIRAAVGLAREAHGERAHLVQALAHPRERSVQQGYEAAGLRRLAELEYLSRALHRRDGGPLPREGSLVMEEPGGPGVGPVRVVACSAANASGAALHLALERSYEQTLDCPELAGLRTTEDIVAAHQAVGQFDPALWWIVEHEGRPEGCVLLNRCPGQACVELVYIGISPVLRGRGLGRRLLARAVEAVAALEPELRCAVDSRNAPARAAYERAGFVETDRRVAFVALGADIAEA